jgi:thiamine monophosphate synthase
MRPDARNANDSDATRLNSLITQKEVSDASYACGETRINRIFRKGITISFTLKKYRGTERILVALKKGKDLYHACTKLHQSIMLKKCWQVASANNIRSFLTTLPHGSYACPLAGANTTSLLVW